MFPKDGWERIGSVASSRVPPSTYWPRKPGCVRFTRTYNSCYSRRHAYLRLWLEQPCPNQSIAKMNKGDVNMIRGDCIFGIGGGEAISQHVHSRLSRHAMRDLRTRLLRSWKFSMILVMLLKSLFCVIWPLHQQNYAIALHQFEYFAPILLQPTTRSDIVIDLLLVWYHEQVFCHVV